MTAFWRTEQMKHFRKLKAGTSVCFDVQNTAVTLGAEKLFDTLHNRRRKRKGLPNDKEPIGLTQCLDPGYIDCMFKKAGF